MNAASACLLALSQFGGCNQCSCTELSEGGASWCLCSLLLMLEKEAKVSLYHFKKELTYILSTTACVDDAYLVFVFVCFFLHAPTD